MKAVSRGCSWWGPGIGVGLGAKYRLEKCKFELWPEFLPDLLFLLKKHIRRITPQCIIGIVGFFQPESCPLSQGRDRSK